VSGTHVAVELLKKQKAGRLPFAIFRRIVTIKLAAASVAMKMKTDEFRVGKSSLE